VEDAIRATSPWGVDVSSGIEAAGMPGIKDGALMRRFVEAVRAADLAATGTAGPAMG
jgi:phosphoribosylanthranilate isomerase